MMTTQQATTIFRQRLSGLYDAGEVDAMMRVVMETVMHYSPVDVALRANEPLPDFFAARLENILLRLERYEPLQYILGTARFHGHQFKVTPATLIPRPETEQLVDLVIDENGHRDDLRVLDLGTGSGCIAVSLARALKFARVTGVDINHNALAVAQENAAALKVKVTWLEADMLEMPSMPAGEIDIVVSNPPYITVSEQAAMERNVLDYEPHEALFVPDNDPLRYYRAIARIASHVLAPGGRLYVEVNRRLGQQVAALFLQAGLTDTQVRRDSFGNERFVTATQR